MSNIATPINVANAISVLEQQFANLSIVVAQVKLKQLMMAGEIDPQVAECNQCKSKKPYEFMAIDLNAILEALKAEDLNSAFCCKSCMELGIDPPNPGGGKIILA